MMPLDPIFRARLRVHRRYLLGQAFGRLGAAVRSALPLPHARERRAEARASSRDGADATVPARRASTPRERHRRAALRWDRNELATVGLAGPDIRTEEHTVEVAGHPDVRIRIYRPPTAAESAPACLVFAGGAFRIGGIDFPTADAACRRRAARAGVVLIAVDYALAPEARYPTQVEQAYAAWTWVHAHAKEQGVDPARIGIAGTSAGGNIAAVLALMNRDRAGLPLRLLLLEVPVTDLTGAHIDFRPTWALGIPAVIAIRELRSIARTYLGATSRAAETYASPLRARSLRGLPPTLVLTAEYDPLRRDGEAFAARLRTEGVDATAVRYAGVTHDIPIFVGAVPAARRWEDQVVDALRGL